MIVKRVCELGLATEVPSNTPAKHAGRAFGGAEAGAATVL